MCFILRKCETVIDCVGVRGIMAKKYSRKAVKELQYLPQVTILTNTDWERIKGKAKRTEGTSAEDIQKKEKANEKIKGRFCCYRINRP